MHRAPLRESESAGTPPDSRPQFGRAPTCVDEALGLPHGRTAGLIHRATLKRLRTDTDFLLQFLTWSDAFEERWGLSFTLPSF